MWKKLFKVLQWFVLLGAMGGGTALVSIQLYTYINDKWGDVGHWTFMGSLLLLLSVLMVFAPGKDKDAGTE